ncbi:MAG: hypothetical protein OEW64_07140 [Gammaproteobacteria bacterium]|nr:hypothetical protein [Gammaproteobacteria bacterium]MDH5303857.1 hypothetical protein [Gammaproteobacteria bacterium]MDH5321460.1 hypothetical protein [Gammaproteobacteria bacterium]
MPGNDVLLRRVHVARFTYRVITVIVAVVALLLGLDELGVLNTQGESGPFYTIFVVLTFGLVFGGIGLAVVALMASFWLARDWRFALPAWLYTTAAVFVCIHMLLFEGSGMLWIPAAAFAVASLLAVIRAAWFTDL